MNLRRIITGPILAVIFLAVFGYIGWQGQQSVSYIFDNGIIEEKEFLAELPATEIPVEQIEELQIEARSAISVKKSLDGKTDVLFEKNANLQLPIASITKLMTAIIAFDKYDLSQMVSVNSARVLLQMMLVGSDNKAAESLADLMGREKFVGLMNKKAQEIGFKNTFFADPTGLSDKNVSTARDLVKLAEYIIKNYPEIAQISQIKELYVPGVGIIKNTDQLLQELPDAVCSKTGFTESANGCLLLVINSSGGNYIINIILGADDRFAQMQKLINFCK